MSHVRINGRNISRHWLNRQPWFAADRELLKMCVLIILFNYLSALSQIEAACDELVREGAARKLPGGYYELV